MVITQSPSRTKDLVCVERQRARETTRTSPWLRFRQTDALFCFLSVAEEIPYSVDHYLDPFFLPAPLRALELSPSDILKLT